MSLPTVGPKSVPEPVSISTSLVPVFTRKALTEVCSGLARNTFASALSTLSFVVPVSSWSTGRSAVPSDRAVTSKSPSMMRKKPGARRLHHRRRGLGGDGEGESEGG